MLSLHGTDNVTEFVLHNLCHENCFNIKKAAYFIDNPDFDCLKGVAGFARDQAPDDTEGIWSDPLAFSARMKVSSFNQKVRSQLHGSLRKGNKSYEELAPTLANELGMKSYQLCSWDMKHDNHGIVMYEKNDSVELDEQSLINGMSLLSFCPIF